MTIKPPALPRWAHAALLVLSVAMMVAGQLRQVHTASWIGLVFGLLTRLDAVFVPQVVPLIEQLTGQVPASEAETPSPVTIDPSKSK